MTVPLDTALVGVASLSTLAQKYDDLGPVTVTARRVQGPDHVEWHGPQCNQNGGEVISLPLDGHPLVGAPWRFCMCQLACRCTDAAGAEELMALSWCDSRLGTARLLTAPTHSEVGSAEWWRRIATAEENCDGVADSLRRAEAAGHVRVAYLERLEHELEEIRGGLRDAVDGVDDERLCLDVLVLLDDGVHRPADTDDVAWDAWRRATVTGRSPELVKWAVERSYVSDVSAPPLWNSAASVRPTLWQRLTAWPRSVVQTRRCERSYQALTTAHLAAGGHQLVHVPDTVPQWSPAKGTGVATATRRCWEVAPGVLAVPTGVAAQVARLWGGQTLGPGDRVVAAVVADLVGTGMVPTDAYEVARAVNA